MPKRKQQHPASTSDKPLITTPDRYTDWIGCVGHLRGELGRANIPIEELRPYQSTILSELEDGPHEQAMASMQEWSGYDLQLLLDRVRGVPAKPRIDVTLLITTKDNLAVEWEPTNRGSEDCDWKYWRALRQVADRPTNELLFIRDLGHALISHRVATEPCEGPEWQREHYRSYRRLAGQVDATLLIAAAGLVASLKSRLEESFEVRMKTDIFMAW